MTRDLCRLLREDGAGDGSGGGLNLVQAVVATERAMNALTARCVALEASRADHERALQQSERHVQLLLKHKGRLLDEVSSLKRQVAELRQREAARAARASLESRRMRGAVGQHLQEPGAPVAKGAEGSTAPNSPECTVLEGEGVMPVADAHMTTVRPASADALTLSQIAQRAMRPRLAFDLRRKWARRGATGELTAWQAWRGAQSQGRCRVARGCSKWVYPSTVGSELGRGRSPPRTRGGRATAATWLGRRGYVRPLARRWRCESCGLRPAKPLSRAGWP